MSDKNDEPVYRIAPSVYDYQDMTLRDYFAGQALIALAHDYSMPFDEMASRIFEMADAMMKERTK